MIPIDYTKARRLIAKGNELELSVFAMVEDDDGATISERRDAIDFFDVILIDRDGDGDGHEIVLEFENLSDVVSAAISTEIEESLDLVSCYVGP